MTNAYTERVIALVDMDCFYCQVEARLNPELKGKPVAVVQYNQWKGGGIIAVNYEAKYKGVTRGMRGAQATELCPNIELVSVPVTRGKADLTKYREASDEVVKIFSNFSDVIQRASIDEAYIDLTKTVKDRIANGFKNIDESQLKSTYIVGHSDLKTNDEGIRSRGVKQWIEKMGESSPDSPEFHLTVGGVIVEEMRNQILEKTGFHCSAGIAHNKVLAKLIAGLHKPKHQTILPQDNVPELYDSLPVYKIRSLGGKFGKHVAEKLSIKYMSELYRFSLQDLQQKFDSKSGKWLYNMARGIETEPVTSRLVAESIGCCKNFRGKEMLTTKQEVKHWIRELSDEISERLKKDLEKNRRRAKSLTISIHHEASSSKCETLNSYETESIAKIAYEALSKFNNAPSWSNDWEPPVQFLGLSAGKFSKEEVGLGAFFKAKQSESPAIAEERPPPPEGENEQRSFFLSFLNNRIKPNRAEPEPEPEPDPPIQPSTSGVDAESTEETELCAECNREIKIVDFFEHLDYHAALKLQSEIEVELRVNRMSTPATKPEIPQKRKRNMSGKRVEKKHRDIKSYFKIIPKK